jgi:hypothetical protein
MERRGCFAYVAASPYDVWQDTIGADGALTSMATQADTQRSAANAAAVRERQPAA